MLWLSVCLCVCSAWHPDTLPTHSSLKKTYIHSRRYTCILNINVCIYAHSMLAVPVSIYVLSLSTCRHLYTFMYTPSLSIRPIDHTPKSYAYNVNNNACAHAHTHTHTRTHARTHARTCASECVHSHTCTHTIPVTMRLLQGSCQK